MRRGDGVATVMREAEKELNTDELISRRNDISLQGIVTTAAAVREVEEEEEDVAMKAVLSQLSDTAVSAFNLAFLTVTETAAAS
ncbi:uncharacterized protein BDCG_16694 [Blastomyces dermatitidis ER-3]|uniref:Uncharacterized protein n=1 Tax=Ajellomyces dermatitidis (strain ER-3 / ATCC MYA-2586) TaxID=559297 RepID=A0ABX2VTS7_AJEDR|nr:uncharacterized protein BDCG_16694 [Blastomyces dermatitidis ER-3]OAT00592.1 hypothetical protein BDCG_16694 [Blastomyces dermatitidis ER-3]